LYCFEINDYFIKLLLKLEDPRLKLITVSAEEAADIIGKDGHKFADVIISAIPFVMLPSIAAVAHGVLFGSFSVFLVYMMPAIWIGNFLLVYTIQQSKNFIS
jgi:hypothetical protein